MQVKTGNHNKKQLNAVQNLSAQKSTETPQIIKNRGNRARYECNNLLALMIKQANLTNNPDLISLENILSDSNNPDRILNWFKKFMSQPIEVQNIFFQSKENQEYAKNNSREFWYENIDLAEIKLNELLRAKKISNDELRELEKSEYTFVSDFLVEQKFYGYEYSCFNQWFKKNTEPYIGYFEQKLIEQLVIFEEAFQRFKKLHFLLEAIAVVAVMLKNKQIDRKVDSFNRVLTYKKADEISIYRDILTNLLEDNIPNTTIKINQNGEIHFSISDWADALQGVDITRIRRCEICQYIFWANRKDTYACSIKHAKVRQMRLLRANWKESGELYVRARKSKQNKKENK